jgi:hypothetical protein
VNVSVKLVVTVGEGREKRDFVVESHACGDPLNLYDPGWMIPELQELEREMVSPSQAVSQLARQLGEHMTELVLQAEADKVLRWEGSGLPERIE